MRIKKNKISEKKTFNETATVRLNKKKVNSSSRIPAPPVTERLQVYLSHRGICSRRKALVIVQQGRVSVNKKVETEPSFLVEAGKDVVSLDGKVVEDKVYEYFLMHKPQGYVTTKEDRFAKKKVFDLLPRELQHLNPVGRLDKDTEGLLLFTNDGDLIYQLTHPRFNINKVYEVHVYGQLKPTDIKKLEQGVVFDEKKTSPSKVNHVKYTKKLTKFHMTIHEGRKRQVRRMLECVGFKVIYLKRIVFGPLNLGFLRMGGFRPLKKAEVSQLKKKV